MDSQVVYDANSTPVVTIISSPDKANGSLPNGSLPNGHTNGHVPNGHAPNGHLNGHIPSDNPSTATHLLNDGLSPPKENGHVYVMPRSPRLGTPHRRQYVPLEANDDDEMGELRPAGSLVFSDKMEAAIEEEQPPKDRFYLVYMIMALHGVGTLLPWNMFITAEAYFVKHKFGNVSDDAEYKDKFVSYIGISSFIPNLTFLFICLFFPAKSSRFTTIIAVNVMLSLFVLTTILAVVDSTGWPKVFFGITVTTIILFNCGSAVYQSGLYAMCAKLPSKYMQSYIMGQGIGGSLCAVIGIVTLAAVGTLKVAAILYFASAVIVLFLCVITLFTLVKMPFVKYYLDQVKETSLEEKEREALEGDRPPLLKIFREIWLQMYNIWACFFVTLCVFPAVMVLVRPTVPKPHSTFLEHFYTPLTCFLAFNLFDFLGSCIPAWVKWPSARYTWILTTARVLFLPLFLFANYRPDTRTLPVFLNDWAYIIVVIAMSLSNGYLKTIVMMDGPQAVSNPNWAGKAASMMVFALVLGIFCGIQFSLAYPYMVTVPIATETSFNYTLAQNSTLLGS